MVVDVADHVVADLAFGELHDPFAVANDVVLQQAPARIDGRDLAPIGKLGVPRHQDVQVVAANDARVAAGQNLHAVADEQIALGVRLAADLDDVAVVVAGADSTSYGPSPRNGGSWKERCLQDLGNALDPARVHFTGTLPYRDYLKVLQVSRVHVYLTYPFVLSWSMLEAMATGCVLIASDTAPVTEVVQDGVLQGYFLSVYTARKLGLKTTGAIVAWGDNTYGQCTVPGSNSGFAAIAGGAWHSLGARSDGTVVAWGRNDFGQCTVPAPNTGLVAVAGGDRHSVGLRADGSIAAWGSNSSGQCTIPAPNTGFVAIAAGGHHSLGLRADGTIVAIANPAIQKDLKASLADVQWITNGYLLALAVALITAGKLGDRFGHRQTFLVGVIGFAAASTEYVFLLDDDDLLEPTALEKTLWFLQSYPEYAFANGWSVGFGALFGPDSFQCQGVHGFVPESPCFFTNKNRLHQIDYSYRRAVIGSTRRARSAGPAVAAGAPGALRGTGRERRPGPAGAPRAGSSAPSGATSRRRPRRSARARRRPGTASPT